MKTTALKLNSHHLERLLDGLESLEEPLGILQLEQNQEPWADWKDHHYLMERLRFALTRVQA